MLGVVLCGGKSSRMGKDKGLLASDNETWAGKLMEKLKDLRIRIVISVNAGQLQHYNDVLPDVELIVDNDSLQLHGPMAAVMSVHETYPMEDLLVVACDMPYMDALVLNELQIQYNKYPGSEGYVFTNKGEPEPLCAIYSATGLSSIKFLYDQGKLIRHSMKFMLDQLSIVKIPISENWGIYFRNINTHADLNGQ